MLSVEEFVEEFFFLKTTLRRRLTSGRSPRGGCEAINNIKFSFQKLILIKKNILAHNKRKWLNLLAHNKRKNCCTSGPRFEYSRFRDVVSGPHHVQGYINRGRSHEDDLSFKEPDPVVSGAMPRRLN